jgi:curli biogenesis system outer membrane secretion channel CsgG
MIALDPPWMLVRLLTGLFGMITTPPTTGMEVTAPVTSAIGVCVTTPTTTTIVVTSSALRLAYPGHTPSVQKDVTLFTVTASTETLQNPTTSAHTTTVISLTRLANRLAFTVSFGLIVRDAKEAYATGAAVVDGIC